MNSALAGKISRWLAGRGMILVLLMLAVFLGFATLADQNPNDADAGTALAQQTPVCRIVHRIGSS
jgi:hypothetical protein